MINQRLTQDWLLADSMIAMPHFRLQSLDHSAVETDHSPDRYLHQERSTISLSFGRDGKHTRAHWARCTRFGLRRDAACRLKSRRRSLLSFSGGVRGRVADAPANIGSPPPPPPPPPPRHSTSLSTRPARGRCRGSRVHVVRNRRPDVRPFAGQPRQRRWRRRRRTDVEAGKTSRVGSPIVVLQKDRGGRDAAPTIDPFSPPLDVCTARQDSTHPQPSERHEYNARDNTARRWWTEGGWLRRGVSVEEDEGVEKDDGERTVARKFRARVHGPVKVARLLPSYVIVAREIRGGERERDAWSAVMRSVYIRTQNRIALCLEELESLVSNDRMLTLFLPRCNLVSITLHLVVLVELILEDSY